MFTDYIYLFFFRNVKFTKKTRKSKWITYTLADSFYRMKNYRGTTY